MLSTIGIERMLSTFWSPGILQSSLTSFDDLVPSSGRLVKRLTFCLEVALRTFCTSWRRNTGLPSHVCEGVVAYVRSRFQAQRKRMATQDRDRMLLNQMEILQATCCLEVALRTF